MRHRRGRKAQTDTRKGQRDNTERSRKRQRNTGKQIDTIEGQINRDKDIQTITKRETRDMGREEREG